MHYKKKKRENSLAFFQENALANALNNAGSEIVFVRIPKRSDIDVTKHWVCQENCLKVITLL